jgi:thiosulfate dehydrogenase
MEEEKVMREPTLRTLVFAGLCIAVLAAIAIFHGVSPAAGDPAAIAAHAAIPSGPEGDLIRYGRSLITNTQKFAPQYIQAGMSCSACHINGGTKPRGGSLLGVYAKFPQWNKRSKRFITLGDRLQECFLYSMNGTPPAPYSREIIAMTAYIAFLSRGAEVGKGFPNQGFVTLHAPNPPDKAAGAKIYAAQCAACHGVNGAGNAAANFPPLWGAKSFNDGAGMNTKMGAFVKVNMPLNAPGSLTDQQAVDVAAFVLSHSRPHFNRSRIISFPQKPAGFF